MIRWSYLLPRLALAVMLLVAAWWLKDPLLRWLVVESGEEFVRAKIDVGQLRTSVVQTELELRDIAVADPRATMKNLFEAESLRLSVEKLPLANRKLVIREGEIHGLRFGTERTTSGELGPRWLPRIPGLTFPGDEIRDVATQVEARARQLLQQWLGLCGGLLDQQLDREFEQLESVRLARELGQRWQAEYQRWEAQLAGDKARIDQVRRNVQSPDGEPLRRIEQARDALEQLRAIERNLTQFGPEMEHLKRQVAQDRDAMQAAQQRDLERLRQRFHLEQFDAEHLTDYFLGPELGPRVREIARWVVWGRTHFPRRTEEGPCPGPERQRGRDILFPITGKTPDFLARELAVDGWIDYMNQRYRFEGQVMGLTSQPDVYGEPTTLKLAIAGTTPMRIEAVVDHTQIVPRERILFDCPALAQPQRTLGRPEEIALSIAPGSAHLWVLLDLQGERLSGKLQLRQEQLELRPEVAARYGGAVITKGLQAAASRITAVQVVVDLAGTLQQPKWSVRSDLGPQLGAALNWLVQSELNARQEQILASFRQRLQQDLAAFDRLLSGRQQELVGTLQMGNTELQQLLHLAAQRIPGAEAAGEIVSRVPGGVGMGVLGGSPSPAMSPANNPASSAGAPNAPPATAEGRRVFGQELPQIPAADFFRR